MIAYFIGGSWDLAKRHVQDCPPVWEVISVPRMSGLIAPSAEDERIIESVKPAREFYVRLRHDHEKDVAIYICEEW